MTDIKELRKLAKLYGGKALTGSAKQKAWAEQIRSDYLNNSISDASKEELIALGGPVNTSKFWILNRENLGALTKASVLAADNEIRTLIEKHYCTLSRSGAIGPKEEAKEEIYQCLRSAKVNVGFTYHQSIPNFDPFDVYGELLDMEMVGGRMQEVKKKRWG